MNANIKTETTLRWELGYENRIERQIFKAKTPPVLTLELHFQYV